MSNLTTVLPEKQEIQSPEKRLSETVARKKLIDLCDMDLTSVEENFKLETALTGVSLAISRVILAEIFNPADKTVAYRREINKRIDNPRARTGPTLTAWCNQRGVAFLSVHDVNVNRDSLLCEITVPSDEMLLSGRKLVSDPNARVKDFRSNEPNSRRESPDITYPLLSGQPGLAYSSRKYLDVVQEVVGTLLYVTESQPAQ